ncbi:hypothetical protein CEXT_224761 [Caerostris extrusa]|uniref:Uncharacterized protein n=1 Tax=Caerostris extrusa TaxID=172846 RepID=A0AAV4ULW2_CAEEX|nr:hypothetical protein CEXT_224761 [Caerostris extrusa]
MYFSDSYSLATLASLVVLKKLSIIRPSISFGNIQNRRTLSILSLSMKGTTVLNRQPHSPLAGCRNRGTLQDTSVGNTMMLGKWLPVERRRCFYI